MKKIYSLLLASALVFTSCSDFLDTKPQGKLTQDIFFGEEEGALMGINAIFSNEKLGLDRLFLVWHYGGAE